MLQISDGNTGQNITTLSGYYYGGRTVTGMSESVLLHFHTNDDRTSIGWNMTWTSKLLQQTCFEQELTFINIHAKGLMASNN